MTRFDRFVKLTMWASKRYSGKEEFPGRLVIDRGGVPSRYRKIEDMAYTKYVKEATQSKGEHMLTKTEKLYGYFHGDKGYYTGKKTEGVAYPLYEIELIEGHLKGTKTYIRHLIVGRGKKARVYHEE